MTDLEELKLLLERATELNDPVEIPAGIEIVAHVSKAGLTAARYAVLGEIPSLIAEIERLRAALEEIARVANHFDGIPPAKYFGDVDGELRYPDSYQITFALGQLRRARTALGGTDGK